MSHLREVATYKGLSDIDSQRLWILGRRQSQVVSVHQSSDLLPDVLGLLQCPQTQVVLPRPVFVLPVCRGGVSPASLRHILVYLLARNWS